MMSLHSKRILFLTAFFCVPFLVFAADDIAEVIDIFLLIFDALIGLIITLALILFLWGVIKFIVNADNTEERSSGKNFMIWGIVGLFVMVSVWGLVQVIQDTFTITGTDAPVTTKRLTP